MVGTTSIDCAGRSSTVPVDWPGALTKNGVQATSWYPAADAPRMEEPARNEIPWSAVTTTSDRS